MTPHHHLYAYAILITGLVLALNLMLVLIAIRLGKRNKAHREAIEDRRAAMAQRELDDKIRAVMAAAAVIHQKTKIPENGNN